MATYTNAFDSYQVFQYGGNPPYGLTASPPDPNIAAVIQCYRGDLFVGRMAFYVPVNQPVPPNTTISPLGISVPSIHYPLSCFDQVYEVLRYTKLLYLFLDDVSLIGMLATSQSVPVGEQEGK